MPRKIRELKAEIARQGFEEVIEMYLEAWQAEGELIPQPRTLQVAS